MDFNKEFETLYRLTESHFAKGEDSCHDFTHTLRVIQNCKLILRTEPKANEQIVLTAALLHDIGRVKENLSKGKCHAKVGAKMSKKILAGHHWPDEYIDDICQIIRRHRFRAGAPPETLEQQIVYDADKLDSLGAVGVGRAFLFAGRLGAKLHNTAEEALSSEEYSVEDTAYREYLVKLRHVPEKLFTTEGRRLANQRCHIMQEFFEQLNSEVFLDIK